jgi:excisionase family DNA binding protein
MANGASLTTGDVARLCGVSFRTVIRWIERGWLKGYKLPGRGDNRVRPDDLRAFLREHRMPVPGALQPGGRRVLVVEDDPAVARRLGRALRGAGFDARVAPGPLQAGSMVESFRPAVILVDVDVPALGGAEALRFLRSRGPAGGVRIVALAKRGRRAGPASGADAVLVKPAGGKDVVDKVSDLSGWNRT